jgi:membrane protein YdbS with pleckstrin-like domain
MEDIVIRPSLKLIWAAYAAIALLVVASLVLYSMDVYGAVHWGVALLPALLLLWPLKRHIQSRFTRLILSGDRLCYETGVLSRSKRLIQITKVQDVRVDQTLMRRMLGMGNLSLETAGETSRLVMQNVDSPDRVAEDILRIAHANAEGSSGRSGPAHV